jgi:hypothetical protein
MYLLPASAQEEAVQRHRQQACSPQAAGAELALEFPGFSVGFEGFAKPM